MIETYQESEVVLFKKTGHIGLRLPIYACNSLLASTEVVEFAFNAVNNGGDKLKDSGLILNVSEHIGYLYRVSEEIPLFFLNKSDKTPIDVLGKL